MSKRANAGYTLVEVMVALSVLAVGVTGILSMLNASVQSNRRAQEMTIATNIARRWQERIRTDAQQWNSPSQRQSTSDLGTDTRYLCAVVGCPGLTARPNAWFVPIAPASALETAAYDAFGNEVAVGLASVRYCVNARMNWIRPDGPGRQGIIRSEVRVWWYREGVGRLETYDNCGSAAGLVTMGGDTEHLHFVYTVSAVSGNPL